MLGSCQICGLHKKLPVLLLGSSGQKFFYTNCPKEVWQHIPFFFSYKKFKYDFNFISPQSLIIIIFWKKKSLLIIIQTKNLQQNSLSNGPNDLVTLYTSQKKEKNLLTSG